MQSPEPCSPGRRAAAEHAEASRRDLLQWVCVLTLRYRLPVSRSWQVYEPLDVAKLSLISNMSRLMAILWNTTSHKYRMSRKISPLEFPLLIYWKLYLVKILENGCILLLSLVACCCVTGHPVILRALASSLAQQAIVWVFFSLRICCSSELDFLTPPREPFALKMHQLPSASWTHL